MGDFAFPSTSCCFLPHCGTQDRAFFSEPHGLGTSELLAVRRTKLCAAERRDQKRSLCPSLTLPSPLTLELPNVHINIVLEAQSPCFSHPSQRKEEQGLGLGPVQSLAMAFHWLYNQVILAQIFHLQRGMLTKWGLSGKWSRLNEIVFPEYLAHASPGSSLRSPLAVTAPRPLLP